MQGSTTGRLAPAWEELLQKLREFYINKRPYSLEPDQRYMRLQMGTHEVTKFTSGDHIACQVAYPNGYLKWLQIGDNTSDVLCMYGADPDKAVRLDMAPRDVCEPLELIAVFRSYEPEDYWLYVTFGLSNLYASEPQPDSPHYSGYGFELTMRVPCEEDDYEFPKWAPTFLHQYAKYVFEENNIFEAGHYIDGGAPIFDETPTAIEAFIVASDVQLGELETASGTLETLQLVGVTRDELNFAQAIGIHAFTEGLRQMEPLLMTDYSRTSYLEGPLLRAFHEPAMDAIEQFIEGGQLEQAKQAALALRDKMVTTIEGSMYYESLLALARVLSETEEYDEAQPVFKEALKVITHASGETNPLAGSVHFALGNMYTKMGDYGQAEQSYLDAQRILSTSAPEQVVDLADIATYLGMLHLTAGRNDAAEAQLREALRLLQEVGESDRDIIDGLIAAVERQGKANELAELRIQYGR
jgi:tetratricopeptide (TPR) repeat protein